MKIVSLLLVLNKKPSHVSLFQRWFSFYNIHGFHVDMIHVLLVSSSAYSDHLSRGKASFLCFRSAETETDPTKFAPLHCQCRITGACPHAVNLLFNRH